MNGFGELAGFLGMNETKDKLTEKASMIYHDLVVVKIEFVSLEEKNEVMKHIFSTRKGQKVGQYYGSCNDVEPTCIFKVKSSAEQDFREAIQEAIQAREARLAEQAKEAREANQNAERKKFLLDIPRPLPVAPSHLRMPRNGEFKQGGNDEPAADLNLKPTEDENPNP